MVKFSKYGVYLFLLVLLSGIIGSVILYKTNQYDSNLNKVHKEIEKLNTQMDNSNKENKKQIDNLKQEINKVKLDTKRQISHSKSRQVMVVSRSGGNKRYVGKWHLTAYSPTGNPTASGARMTPYVSLSIDNSKWKFGTKFYIEGLGVYTAQDTGGAINGTRRGDVAVSNDREARIFGVQYRNVYVIE